MKRFNHENASVIRLRENDSTIKNGEEEAQPGKLCMFLGAIQVLRNAMGGGWVSAFSEKSVTKMCGSTLLALRGGGWGSNSLEKSVT